MYTKIYNAINALIGLFFTCGFLTSVCYFLYHMFTNLYVFCAVVILLLCFCIPGGYIWLGDQAEKEQYEKQKAINAKRNHS